VASFISLKKRQEFKKISSLGKRWVTSAFILQYLPQDEELAPHQARFGFTASRKIGGAVQRNRARRRLKEIVRLNIIYTQTNCDYVLIARDKALTLDFQKLQRDFRWALEHIHAL